MAKVLNLLLFMIAAIVVTLPAMAQNDYINLIDYNEKVKKTQISIGSEFSTLSTDEGTLSGYGARLGLNYNLTPKYSIGFFLGQAYNLSSIGLSSIYTNFTASFHYALQGSLLKQTNIISVGNKKILSEASSKTSIWDLHFGVEQILLNGTSQIFPATGVSIGSGKDFYFWKQWWKVSGRFSHLVAKSTNVSAVFVNFSMELPF